MEDMLKNITRGLHDASKSILEANRVNRIKKSGGKDHNPDNMFDKLEEASVKLDELSKPFLGRYIKKATNDAALNHGKVVAARKDADQASSISNGLGLDTPSDVRQKAAQIISSDARNRENHHFRKSSKRIRGVEKATDKLTKEETDLIESAAQLDEVSKETIRSYMSKASETLKGRGRKSPKKIQRVSNIELAKSKLSKILDNERTKHESAHKAKVEEVHNHFQKEAPKILATHGFEKLHSANDRTNYHKGHENGHSTIVSIHHKPNDSERGLDYGSKFNIHSTDGSGTHMGHNHHVTRAGTTEDHKIRVVHGFHNSLISAVDTTKSDRF